eukprot:COSAG01_NODE_96_length_26789_cov_36.697089_24_plen_164_part_00
MQAEMQAQTPGRGGDGGAADPRSLHERTQGGTNETAAAASSSFNSVRRRGRRCHAPPPTSAPHTCGRRTASAVSGRRGFIRRWLPADCVADACRPEISIRGANPLCGAALEKPAGRPTELVSALHVVRPAPGFTVAGRSPSPAQLRARHLSQPQLPAIEESAS